MKINFCTLFNSAYLSRGLAMYESLLQHCPDFHLYVFAFDDKCYGYLKKLNREHLTVITLKEFEDPELLRVKSSRSAAEYCWTSTPSTIRYCIQNFNLENCTYIDADMLFYSDPKVLIEEMGDRSVLITEHRYTKEYDQSGTSGKYCVQFVTFKKNESGMKVLEWWRNACIEWCYARHEDGKFGDQKYLDDWTSRFDGIHELKHLGGGIAPWNVQQYIFKNENSGITGVERTTKTKFKAVFYHYHSLKFYKQDMLTLCDEGYELSKEVIDIFYRPYIKILDRIGKEIKTIDASFDPHGIHSESPYKEMGLDTIVKLYLRRVRSSKKNIFGKGLAKRIKQHYFFNIKDL